MSKSSKIGDLVVLKDFFSYEGGCADKKITSPCVGIIVELSSSSAQVHWLDDSFCSWENNQNLIIISDVGIIAKKKKI